jgi:hypothetical protein
LVVHKQFVTENSKTAKNRSVKEELADLFLLLLRSDLGARRRKEAKR